MKSARMLTLFAFCVYAIVPSFANAAECFTAPVVYPSGYGAAQIILGDFNNDGNLDFVIPDNATCPGPGANLFLGDGHGAFRIQPIMELESAFYLAAGDFNGDGNLDLAASGGCSGSRHLEVALGNGDGTFQPAQRYDEPGGYMVAGDFNNDGILDLIFQRSEYTGGARDVWFGNGDGTFRIGSRHSIPWPSTGPMTAADIDGDGTLDLLFRADQLVVQHGNGDGTFSRYQYREGDQFAVADVTGDGLPDVLTIPYAPNHQHLLVYRANPNGMLTRISTRPATRGFSLVVADLDGDGIPDVAATDSSAIILLKGAGDGTFPTRRVATNSPVLYDYLLAAGDFNNDGLPDLVTVDGFYYASVLINTGACR